MVLIECCHVLHQSNCRILWPNYILGSRGGIQLKLSHATPIDKQSCAIRSFFIFLLMSTEWFLVCKIHKYIYILGISLVEDHLVATCVFERAFTYVMSQL